jgi:hypothetical protein
MTTALAISWNPAIPFAEAIAIAAAFIVAGIWLAWSASLAVNTALRGWLLALRTAGLLLLALFWLNPGQWREDERHVRRDWLVLLDRSASMESEHDENATRWKAGVTIAERLHKESGKNGDVRIRTFSTQLDAEPDSLSATQPKGSGTNLTESVASALDQSGSSLAGLVVVSDGRQTSPDRLQETALRARGLGVKIHAVPLGGAWGTRDLSVSAVSRQVTGFRDQPVKISARVENHGLGPIKPAIALLGPDGREIARKDVSLTDGARETVVFEPGKVPEGGGDYTLRADPWPGEHIPGNNADTVRVNLLASKTRVLLLEGAPYWDSKFLAQLLRQQNAVEILTVHRLNEERYFRVEAKGAEPLQSPDAVFPSSAEELARYDLIVFGKGADGFLTPARLAALHGFVRDQGGAILFARGKSYPGRLPALESLEPVEWGETTSGAWRFVPSHDAAQSLFGSALPSADDRVWSTLPPLEDAHEVARLKPFARVLAEGTVEGRGTRLPMLIVRRIGRGTVAAINADGLWRWDFRPEIREQGEVYQQFWVQLMQWCATYSEFRPGEDYAIRLSSATTGQGEPVRALITWRGPASPAPRPTLKLTRGNQPAGESSATPLPGGEGGAEWVAMLTPNEADRYQVRVTDPSRPGREEGDATLTVLAPPKESDDLRPDVESLATLVRESGGTSYAVTDVEKLASSLWSSDPAAVRGKPQWEPSWPTGWMALLVGLAFGSEWWIRRREGLL